ncbi:MAG: DNA translocase FtsK [Anaerolineales bacterium]|nr:DNA translocase FtsK [Anaerolineales bacterium]
MVITDTIAYGGFGLGILLELVALAVLAFKAWGDKALIGIPYWVPVRKPFFDIGLHRQRRSPEYRHWLEIETARRLTVRREWQRRKDIRREAKRLKRSIVASLTRQGYARAEQRKGAVKMYSKVKVEAVLYTDDALYYKISNRTPFGITFTALAEPEVAQNIGAAIYRDTKWEFSTKYGLWLVVGLESGIVDIPKSFPYYSDSQPRNARDLLPKTKKWHVPVGLTYNRRFVSADLRDFIHALVSGRTGGGKSVFINQWLCSIITRLSPRDIKIALIDLKGGLEFASYEDIPHLLTPMVYERENVPAVLEMFEKEKLRRFNIFRETRVKDIKAWNETQPGYRRLPYWLLLFDEIQNLMLDKNTKSQVETLMRDLSEQGRAVGLMVVLCTQYPDKAVITTAIKANCPTKIAFGSTMNGSMIVLDNARASSHEVLEAQGRAVFRMAGQDDIIVQPPYLGRFAANGGLDKRAEQDMINALVAESRERWLKPEEDETDMTTDIFQRMAEVYHGKCTAALVLDEFLKVEGTTKAMLLDVLSNWSFNYEDQQPIINLKVNDEDVPFVLVEVPQRGGRRRQLLPVADGRLPADGDEAIQMYKSLTSWPVSVPVGFESVPAGTNAPEVASVPV